MADADGKLFRVAVLATNQGEQVVNVLHVRGRDDTVTATGACTAVLNGFVHSFKTIQSNQVSYISINAVEVSRLPDRDSAEMLLADESGTTIGIAEAPQLALRVAIRTAFSDRTRRGRCFISGIPDIWTVNGRVDGSWVSTVQGALVLFAGAMVGPDFTGGAQLGIFSRKRYEILSNPFDDYWKPARSIQAAGVLSTMRSRKPGG